MFIPRCTKCCPLWEGEAPYGRDHPSGTASERYASGNRGVLLFERSDGLIKARGGVHIVLNILSIPTKAKKASVAITG